MLRVVVIVWLVAVASVARAETIALLPLDAEKKLEVYGHPVAAEIGRALKAAGIEVVIVGATMDVPDRAQLIVDGAIKPGKGDAITLSLRIRDPRNGTVLETLPASATTLTAIDKAAAELSAKLVPAARTHLAALAKGSEPVRLAPSDSQPRPIVAVPVAAPALPFVLTAATPANAESNVQFLAHALGAELPAWLASKKRTAKQVDPNQLQHVFIVGSVANQHASLGIGLEVLGFTVEPGQVPLARARVRVRVSDGKTIMLERVVRTDTIVGDRDITQAEMGARAAREVFAIVNAQLRRLIQGWR
jgi:hypothetical protein